MDIFHSEHTVAPDRLQTYFMLNILLLRIGCGQNYAGDTIVVDRLRTYFMLNVLAADIFHAEQTGC